MRETDRILSVFVLPVSFIYGFELSLLSDFCWSFAVQVLLTSNAISARKRNF